MQNITVEIKKKSIGISSNLVAIGKGGMNPGIYDPNEIKADVFNMDNMVDGEEKHYVTDEQIETWNAKQDALTAGDNITIDENNVISATDTTYTAGDNVSIDNNVISAVDTTYTAGEGISIDENNVISNTQTSAEWGNIQGDIEDQTDLQQALGEKQDVLTAGENIDITNNVISATDTTYESCDFDINDLGDSCNCRQTWNNKQNALTAGDNIDITGDVISATDTTYESCDFDIKDLADSCSCRQTWNAKQNALTAGDNIDITGDTISATDTIPNNATLTIQKNSCTLDTFTADASEDKTINITVPVTAADVNALPDTTKYGASVEMSINSSTYVVTLTLKDQNGDTLGNAQTIDLPLESVVVSGSYDADTKEVVLVLKDGSEIRFSVADLVSGLQTEITVDNKLDADLVDDSTSTNKFVTAADKCNWDAKADICDIPTDNCQLANGCGYTTCTGTLVPSDIENLAQCCDIPTDNCQLGNGCGYTTCTGTLVPSDIEDLAKCCDIPTDNCQLANGCGYTTCTGTLVPSDIQNLAQCCDIPTDNCQLANSCGYTTCTGTLVQSDIQNLAQCCDIPTDNCQLNNGCGYTTCTGDMEYSDFNFTTLTGNSVTLALNSTITPSANFTINAPSTIKDGQSYVLRVDNGATAYTMTLGTNITNPTGVSLTLTANTIDQFVFLGVDGVLELQEEIPDLSGYQTKSCMVCGLTGADNTHYPTAKAVSDAIPTDNCQLANSCGYTTCTGTLVPSDLCGYQKTCNMVCNLTDADNSHYPTAKAVSDAISGGGFGDMLKSVYDPCGCEADAFNACNMYNMPHIPTDNCELSNSCGFTTCTGTLVASDIQNLAQCCDVPTDNCQLANSCGYTTCTGTLVPSDLNDYAKCCDIPTNNCQLTNGCGYIKGINCSDVTTALGYTPYNSTNPAGYTTCTGTLVQSDIQNLAQCCDIPTDNCQLANGCDYATCCYVNDSINSVTAYYITKDAQGNQFATYAELSSATTFYSGGVVRTPTRNDYTIVLADENHDDATTRYIYQNNQWEFQYIINETALTQAQLDALNSGITCNKVSCYDGVVSTVSCFGDIVSCDACDFAKPSDIPTDNCQLANGCGYTTCTGTLIPSDLTPYAKSCDLCTVSTTGKYCDLTGTPSLCTVATSGKYCDLTGTPSIPTDNCQLANGCGYTTCTGDMEYDDFNFTTLSGASVTLSLSSAITPSANFTINAPSTIEDGQTYILRVNNGATVYTMSLGTNITNPNSESLTLTANTVDQFVFLGVGNKLELQKGEQDLSSYAKCSDIPTDNCQLSNSCGYTTCTGTLSTCSDVISALGYTPYSSANPSGYTTCTGTLTSADLACYACCCDIPDTSCLAQCCDIPTNNCQLTNGCGYIKGINCSDVTTALGFTPYNSTNPAGYTTCTGTLTSADLACYACCCDIPTDNCQLTNGCGYTTCTGTLNGGDLKTVNGCCLVGSGDISIQGGVSGWNTYTYSSSTPASIELSGSYFNHKITLLGDGSTTTAIAYASGYEPTPGAKYTFNVINASTTNDALITIFGVQLVVLADNGSSANNIFSFIYDDATSSYKVDVGTMNLLSQNQYNNFTSAKNTDGVFRWIIEDE